MAQTSKAEIVREYGPFPGVSHVHGVSWDGERIWFAGGDRLVAVDPSSGKVVRSLDVQCDAGTAFDGTHLFQIVEDQIEKIDPRSGEVLAAIPSPGKGKDSGLAWAEGTLWVGQYRDCTIHQIDPDTGKVLKTLESSRFVTGVSWVDGELWHGATDGEDSEVRRIDPRSGEVLVRLQMPKGQKVSGVESNGSDLLYCGSGDHATVRAVRRPRTTTTTGEKR